LYSKLAFDLGQRKLHSGRLPAGVDSVKQLLGGNCGLIYALRDTSLNESPLKTEDALLIRATVGCLVVHGVLVSAVLGPIAQTHPNDYRVTTGSLGGIVPSCQVKLVDNTELGLSSTDKPHPRGQVFVASTSAADKTVPYEDHWIATDIFAAILQDGTLSVIEIQSN
jgi:hypothetical protein